MKKTIKFAAALLIGTSLLSTGCLEETFPQQGTVTVDQAGDAPNAFNNFVTACTSTLAGEFLYAGNANMNAYDFGYPSFLLQRDVMGQDIALEDTGYEQFTTWYTCGVGLGPDYAICQVPCPSRGMYEPSGRRICFLSSSFFCSVIPFSSCLPRVDTRVNTYYNIAMIRKGELPGCR